MGQRMHISQLPTLHPKQMTIRPLAIPKVQQHIHTPKRLINHIPPIRKRHSRRYANITRPIRPCVPVQSSFETHARRTPGHGNVVIVEQVEVGVRCFADGQLRVALLLGDSIPVFLGGPVRVPRYVEEPVPRLRDQ